MLALALYTIIMYSMRSIEYVIQVPMRMMGPLMERM